MNNSLTLQTLKKGWVPLILIIVLTIAIIIVSIISLLSGWQTIFQNLFYFPIILACVYYVKRGFVFSVLLACSYFVLIAIFSNDPVVLEGALIRVLIFILVAGVITYLSMIRIRAEDALKESEQKYRDILDNATDLIQSSSPEGKIIYASKAWMKTLGYSETDIPHLSFKDFIHEDSLLHCMEALNRLLSGENIGTIEAVFVSKDGKKIFVEGNANCQFINGKPAYTRGIFHDITKRKQMENALVLSEQTYHSYVDNSPMGIFVADGNTGQYLDINPAACNILGYSREELLCMNVLDLALPEEKQQTLDKFIGIQEELKTESSVSFEMQLKKKDGSVCQVILSVVKLPDNAIMGFTLDITERKKAEEALRESEARFRSYFDMPLNGIAITSPQKGWLQVNDRICSILGYTREEFVRMNWAEMTHPDDLAREMEQFNRILAGEIEQYTLEKRFIRKDGIEIWTNLAVGCVRDSHGTVDYLVAVVEDITGRKHDEAAFRLLSADLKAIIDHAPAMIWYKDTKNNFIRVNPAAAHAFGLKVEQIEGKSTNDLFPDQAEKYYQDDLDVINSGQPKLGIIEPMTVTSGEQLWVQTDKIPIRDDQGTITGILVFVIDITGRIMLEQEMKYHEQELKQFSTALSTANKKLNLLSGITRHDINNQLTVLMGFLELLEMKQPDTSFSTYFDKITGAAERIQAMIQFTKAYESIGVNTPVWQDTRSLIENAAKDVVFGHILLVNDIPAGTTIFADQLIVKVFFNLMDNAVRYGGKITTIRYSIEEHGSDQVLVCEDDGNGVPAGEKEKIFDRGFGKNTGLGLFLSREILGITGIMIRETGEPGKGARFEMTVPEGSLRQTGNGN